MTRVVVAALLAALSVLTPPASAQAPGRDDTVSIAPDAGFTAAQRSTIERAVASSDVPLKVVATRSLPPAANGSAEAHARNLLADFAAKGDAAVLVFAADALPAYDGWERRRDPDERQLVLGLDVARELDLDERQQFVELVRMVANSTGRSRFDEKVADSFGDGFDPDLDDDFSVEDDPSAGVTALRWGVIGLGVLVVGVLMLFRGRALLGWLRRRRRSQELMDRVGASEAANLADQAKADLLAFGAAIDAETMDDDDVLAHWQAALDHYAEAGRVHDRRSGPKDDRRVIELCARGRERLRLANRRDE